MLRIVYVGNFNRAVSVGEPEIALCLEELGHTVIRVNEGCSIKEVDDACQGADLLLVCKFRCGTPNEREAFMKRVKIPMVAWLFDLYYGL